MYLAWRHHIYSFRAWLFDEGFDPSGIEMERIGDRIGSSNGRVECNWSSLHWRRRQSSGVPPKSCSGVAQQLHKASYKEGSGGSSWDAGRETESRRVARRFVVCRDDNHWPTYHQEFITIDITRTLFLYSPPLVPGLHAAQILITCSMQKRRGKAWSILSPVSVYLYIGRQRGEKVPDWKNELEAFSVPSTGISNVLEVKNKLLLVQDNACAKYILSIRDPSLLCLPT